jgi:hypothetical protein
MMTPGKMLKKCSTKHGHFNVKELEEGRARGITIGRTDKRG